MSLDDRHYLKRKTPLKRGGSLKRSEIKTRANGNDIPPNVRKIVRARSRGRCEVEHPGCTGEATTMHHRKLRRHRDHRPCNILHLCDVMHRRIHADVQRSYEEGWLVRSYELPEKIPWTVVVG